MRRASLAFLFLVLACFKAEQPSRSPAPIGDGEKGKEALVRYSCQACHSIPGLPGSGGSIGPELGGLGRRATIGGGTVATTPENVAAYIENPQALEPNSSMPALGVSRQEARDITAYLLSLD